MKEKIVFTNGCFDILHVGHVRYLNDAKTYGNKLVVGINSDESVRRLKGSSRPLVPCRYRKEMLLALSSVDEVYVFEEETPLELIKKIKPDVLVKGGDYKIDEIVGAKEVESWGGEVFSLSFYEGFSTTDIVEAIKKSLQKVR